MPTAEVVTTDRFRARCLIGRHLHLRRLRVLGQALHDAAKTPHVAAVVVMSRSRRRIIVVSRANPFWGDVLFTYESRVGKAVRDRPQGLAGPYLALNWRRCRADDRSGQFAGLREVVSAAPGV